MHQILPLGTFSTWLRTKTKITTYDSFRAKHVFILFTQIQFLEVSKLRKRIYSSTHTSRFLHRFDNCSRLHQQCYTEILKVRYQPCHVYSQPHGCTTVEIRQHKDNPANFATRGATPKTLNNSIWFTGPAVLSQCSLNIPHTVTTDADTLLPEETKIQTLEITKMQSGILDRFAKFSTWRSLVRAISMLRSFLQHRQSQYSDIPLVLLYSQAETHIIQVTQQEHLIETIRAIENKIAFPKDTAQLNPFLDSNGIPTRWRTTATFTTSTSRKTSCYNTEKVSYHITHHWWSTQVCLSSRSSYNSQQNHPEWILHHWRSSGIKVAFVKLHHLQTNARTSYVPCDGHSTWNQIIWGTSLHRHRPRFTNRKTRGNSSSTKRWAIVFTCLAKRAVHFEVLPDMTTDSFNNGLRRFQSIRGATRSITCDNWYCRRRRHDAIHQKELLRWRRAR